MSSFKRIVLAVLSMAWVGAPAFAQTLTWNNGAANMQWDTSSLNWLNGATPAAWSNAAGENAVFGATGAGAVNLAAGISADSLTFNAPGYTIAGNTLTLLAAASITNNASAAISSTLAGGSGLTKAGNGTLSLSGPLSYSGGTTVNGGRLAVEGNQDFQSLGYTTVGIAGGATLAINYTNVNYLYGQTITSITNLTGAGTFEFDAAGTGAPFHNETGNPSTIALGAGGLFHVVTGTFHNGWGHTGDWSNNLAGLTVESGATFDLWDLTSGSSYWFDALNGAGTIQATEGLPNGGAHTLNVGLANGSGTLSGPIMVANGNSISLVKWGAGRQTLDGNLNLGGAVSVNGGTLELDGTLASSSAVTVNSSGTLDGVGTISGTVTVNNGGKLAAGSSLAPGTLTIADTLELNYGSTTLMRLNRGGSPASDLVAGMSTVTYGGTLMVTNIGGVLAFGDTFTLFQAGAYGGGFSNFNLPVLPAGLSWNVSQLTVNGTIGVASNNVATPTFNPPAGGYVGAQSVTISCQTPGATIYYTTNGTAPTTGSPVYSAPFNVPANAILTIQAFATASGYGNSALGNATYRTVATPAWTDANGGSWPVAGNWSNSVVGQGYGITADFSKLTLAANTTITLDGTQTIGNLALGDLGNTYAWKIDPGSGGSLTLAGSNPPAVTVLNQSATVTAPVGGSSGLTKAGSGTLTLSGSLNYGGATTINAGRLVLGNTFPGNVNSGAAVNITAGTLQANYASGQQSEIYNLTGAGEFDFDGTGGYAIPFYNPNANVCTISMNPGAVFHVVAGTLRNAWSHNNIWDNNRAGLTVDRGATFDLWDYPLGIGYCFDALNGAGTIQSTEGGNPNNLIIGIANGSGSFGGPITDANNSPITLVKQGTGTQILSGACNYSGWTMVSGGTLELDGTLGPASAVTVNSSATLDGVGTINGAVAVNNGGELAAGSSSAPGTLTIANTLALESGSTTFLRVNKGASPASDLVTGLGSVSYGGTLVVTNVGGALALGDSFTLFQASTHHGGFGNFALPVLPTGLFWNVSALTVNGSIAVTNRLLLWTATGLASSSSPSMLASNVQFTATVLTNGVLAGNAGGSMIFSDNGTPISTNNVSGGQAVFNSRSLVLGSHSVTAAYSGDASYGGSASGLLFQIVLSQPECSLENSFIRADLNARGLETIYDKSSGKIIQFSQDEFYVSVGSDTIASSSFSPVLEEQTPTNCSYRLDYGQWTLRANYELEPGWHFVSKQISIVTAATNNFTVNQVDPIDGGLSTAIVAQQPVNSGQLLHFNDGGSAPASHGLFVDLQTAPQYAGVSVSGQQLTASYSPDLVWNTSYGTFQSDRVLLGPYTLSGITYPANQMAEWQYIPDGVTTGGAAIDRAELDALWSAAEAFLLWQPTNSTRIHVAWGETDSQIDVGTAAGQTEYDRILDRAASVGCNEVLCDANNSLLSNPADDTDSWGWENVLWLALGQQIRTNAWYPGSNAIPDSVQSLLNYAQGDKLKLVAYAYPSLPFPQNPAWTAWPGNFADLGQRTFQDWWLQLATNFQNGVGVGGYSFDYVLLGNGNAPSSPYSQWYGWRRVLEQLRRQFPNDVIDGRQQFNGYGVWTWLAGTYPHPISGDEQPMSFTCFPDLHWARVCADRQRWAAWWYRVQNLAPLEITPGYITQQTPRLDPNGNYMKYSPWRVRDWDYLGWRYSVISTIGTAPFNLVVNCLPARDTNEFNAFSTADQQWMRGWFDWSDQHMNVLRSLHPIVNQPQLGRVDGNAAFTNGYGFVFLFNPNYRALTAQFKLDDSIGITNGGPFILRQLYPDAEKGKLILPSVGTQWNFGDSVSLPIPGADALVLEITNIPPVTQPLLLGVPGNTSFSAGRLALTNVTGQVGRQLAVQVLMPAGQTVYSVTVNGSPAGFQQTNNLVSLAVSFPGVPFQRLQPIGSYDPNFMGGICSTQITIPSAVFRELAARTNAWPIPYTADDLKATWLGSQRLLLYVNVANPSPSMPVSLSIDGQPMALTPAYMTIYPLGYNNTFVGWYVDVSSLTPDVPHQFQLTLPSMAQGQFQGMFLDDVEAQFTNAVQMPGTATAVTLNASPNPSGQGGSVTFTASVQTNGQTAGDAGGTVVFMVNLVPLSTNVVSGGIASWSTGNLPAGTNVLTAAYSGYGLYQASLSPPLVQLVRTIPSTPTNLTWHANGASLTIDWPSNYVGWILQVQTNSLNVGLGSNWVDILGTEIANSTNQQIWPGNPAVFYRLRHP